MGGWGGGGWEFTTFGKDFWGPPTMDVFDILKQD